MSSIKTVAAKALITCATVLLRIWYWLCHWCGVQNRIVCLSRQSNNPSIDFELVKAYVTQHYPDYSVVLLAKTLDNRLAYIPHMLKQIYYLATSTAVLLDSYCLAVSLLGKTIHAPVVQMWHSLGNLKRFGYATLNEPEGHSAQSAQLLHMHKGYDSVLISSLSFASEFAQSFGISTSLLYEAPLPRCDLLLDPAFINQQQAKINQLVPETALRKNIVYAPTLRKAPASNEQAAIAALVESVDFSKYNLIYKKHPVSTTEIRDPRVISEYPVDVDMLYVADYIISDYSTVIYEAGLLDIPVFLYAYDWKDYSAKRSLAVDIQNDVPALFTDDPAKIMDAIEADSFNHESYRAFTQANVALPVNETCTERIVNHLLSLTQKATRA